MEGTISPTAGVVPARLAHIESSVTLQGSEDETHGIMDEQFNQGETEQQGEPNPTTPVLTRDESTSEASNAPQEWGFVIYRTVYGNDEEWQTFKKKLWKHVERKRDAIGEAGGDPDGVTFDFIEDESELDGATAEQLRL